MRLGLSYISVAQSSFESQISSVALHKLALHKLALHKQVRSYATRYANDFHLPFCRTNLRKFSVSFQGPTYYNPLENDIIESNSLHSFKTKLKKKLCEVLA